MEPLEQEKEKEEKTYLPKLQALSTHFKDEKGRVVILRGFNLGGDSKLPKTPDGSTWIKDTFSNHLNVSFIGRPFELNEAKNHFSRLRRWGCNCVRLLSTWEAIEHFGPYKYDESYLHFFTQICEMAGQFGIYVFIDLHQDVWSRMTGGDGAPCWIFEKIGLDYTKFDLADCALTMQSKYDINIGGKQNSYPQMHWFSNFRYPANAIMWTLFFGGRRFTPQFLIQDEGGFATELSKKENNDLPEGFVNIQDYLQGHYIGAQIQIARRVAHMSHVIGFDTFNEPCRGWIGSPLHSRQTELKISPPGLGWSAINAFAVSHGLTQRIPKLELSILQLKYIPGSLVTVNSNQTPIWIDNNALDPFEIAGVYRRVKNETHFTIEALNNNYFVQDPKTGAIVDFDIEHLTPFVNRIATNLRNIRSDWIVILNF
eukprot:TRINITY_DN603_c0_g1_i1.p1 TRINITY_DN603_c0_g1~~TRINITY_DN603_c0_g1_i1.p1  ORF type:complete len:427 (-),score=179.20 TRINITY_DN603_c0_g1_i1:1089-2369(-)